MLFANIIEVILIIFALVYLWGGFTKFKKLKTIKDYERRIVVLSTREKWDNIIELSLEMLKKFEMDKSKSIDVFNRLGYCYYMQAKYEQASEYYIKTIELMKKIERNNTITNITPLICSLDTFIKLGRLSYAKEIYFDLINYKYSQKELKKLKEFASLNKII